MSIFGKRKKLEKPEMTLVPVQASGGYDFFAALAKALLLFLVTYGALGGFLSAIEMEYNNGLCMLVIFVIALLFSAAYETGKRWLTNLLSIVYFIFYLYFSISRYRLLNSGFYAIINRLYGIARQYLNVFDGLEYLLDVEETYTAVTMFTLLLGMVVIIILNIMLQKKCSLLKVVALTLPPYAIPLYFDRSPDLIYTLFLLTGYLTVAVIGSGNVREKLSQQMRYVLPITAVLVILVVRIFSFLLPEGDYKSIVPKSAPKESSEENMIQFAQYGLMALFRQEGIESGVSGGKLNKGAMVIPSYENVLKVRYTPYSFHPVYLKAFTGKDYLGDRWTQARNILSEDSAMWTSVDARALLYYGMKDNELHEMGSLQGRGTMDVEKLDENDRYEYQPYYTDYIYTERQGNITSYKYYPNVSEVNGVEGEVSEAYLEVPSSCRNAVERVCREAGFFGTPEEIASQIVNFFQDNYFYTLRPGLYIGSPDYITHFLLESQRGYCAHFASAATMLFRRMGIPARYVEGYAFSYLDVVETGTLVEGADYNDYYKGYSPLGETALIELEIPGSYAHAWVEIYVEDKGWLVVDPTPTQISQDDNTTSFWEAFMNTGSNNTTSVIAESNLGAYLENALGSISIILAIAAMLALVVLSVLHFYRAYRENKLPPQEKVLLEYGRLHSYLSRRHKDYGKLRTLREQLDFIRNRSHIEITGDQEEALYQVYFAESVRYDCEELYRSLRKMRGALKYRKLAKSSVVPFREGNDLQGPSQR